MYISLSTNHEYDCVMDMLVDGKIEYGVRITNGRIEVYTSNELEMLREKEAKESENGGQ